MDFQTYLKWTLHYLGVEDVIVFSEYIEGMLIEDSSANHTAQKESVVPSLAQWLEDVCGQISDVQGDKQQDYLSIATQVKAVFDHSRVHGSVGEHQIPDGFAESFVNQCPPLPGAAQQQQHQQQQQQHHQAQETSVQENDQEWISYSHEGDNSNNVESEQEGYGYGYGYGYEYHDETSGGNYEYYQDHQMGDVGAAYGDEQQQPASNAEEYDYGFDTYWEEGGRGEAGQYEDVLLSAVGVEDALSVKSPSVVFSPEAIYSTLFAEYNRLLTLDLQGGEGGGEREIDLEALVEGVAESLSKALAVATTCKPCRHMLNGGGCLRKDCTFQHESDLASFSCRYWLMLSGCMKNSYEEGGDCPFMHRVPLLTRRSDSISSSSTSSGLVGSTTSGGAGGGFIDAQLGDEDCFPSLPSSTLPSASASSSSRGKIAYASLEYASALKSKPAAGSDPFIGQARRGARSRGGRRPGEVEVDLESAQAWLPGVSFGGDSASVFNVTGNTSGNNGSNGSNNNKTAAPAKVEWTGSGQAVSAEYAALREEARSLAIARNKLLQEATVAYLGGAKGIAKHLSQEGQALNRRMKECHLRAARELFRRKNSSVDVLQKGRVDLHGLHVSEALACLSSVLPALSAMPGGPALVTVVTGSGHHTLGPQKGTARLLPAVQAVLSELGFTYRLVKDDNGFCGGLRVVLRR